MTTDLEAEIQSAWVRAHNLLSKQSPAPTEIETVIADLRNCAEQVRETGSPGERELWWLIRRLAGLSTGMHTPSYLTS